MREEKQSGALCGSLKRKKWVKGMGEDELDLIQRRKVSMASREREREVREEKKEAI